MWSVQCMQIFEIFLINGGLGWRFSAYLNVVISPKSPHPSARYDDPPQPSGNIGRECAAVDIGLQQRGGLVSLTLDTRTKKFLVGLIIIHPPSRQTSTIWIRLVSNTNSEEVCVLYFALSLHQTPGVAEKY